MIDIRVRVTLDVADLEQMGAVLRALLGQATVTMHQVQEEEDQPVTPTLPAVVATKAEPMVKATKVEDGKGDSKRGKVLPYDEFEKLARAEMKRLSLDGRMPSRVLWDAERDQRLPTFEAVRSRFQCATVAELADELELLPPIHAGRQRDGVTV